MSENGKPKTNVPTPEDVKALVDAQLMAVRSIPLEPGVTMFQLRVGDDLLVHTAPEQIALQFMGPLRDVIARTAYRVRMKRAGGDTGIILPPGVGGQG